MAHEERKPMITRENIAESLHRHRLMKGWSQSELGRQAGIGARNIGYWEKGRGEPDITAFIKIAQALEISLEELAGLRNKGGTPHEKHQEQAGSADAVGK